MAIQVQYRRGSASENDIFTGALAEITIDTTNKTIRVHDGATAGGSNIATVAYVDNSISSLSANSITDGTSNVRISGTNGNVTVSVAGTSNVAVFATSGGNITGVLGVTGNITGGNVSAARGAFTNIAGTLETAAQPNITSVGTLSSLSVSGNVTAGNFIGTLNGSGANVTSINATNISSGTLAQARLANSAVTLGSTTLTLGATVTSVTGLSSVTSTTFVGALTGAATTAGTVTTAAQPNITSVGTLTSVSVTGNVTGGNLITGGLISATGGVTGASFTGNGRALTSLSASNIDTGTLAQARLANANVVLGSTTLALGTTTATLAGLSSVTSTTFVGALTGAATTAGTVTTAAQPNITSVGTLSSLSVSGNVTGGNITTAGLVNAGTLQTTGTAIIGGNLVVNGNTTSVNVDDLHVQDPVIGLGRGPNNAALTTNDGKARGTQLWYYDTATAAERSAFVGYNNQTGKLLAAANVSIANELVTVNSLGSFVVGGVEAVTVSATGNVTAGNVSGTTGAFTTVTGNGRALTSLSASNIDTGTLAQARLANSAVTLGSTALTLGATVTTVAGLSSVTSTTFVGALTGAATTAGTVTTAAQPNITSVGTLTSVSVTGNVTSGNVSGATGAFTTVTGNGRALTSMNASNLDTGTLPAARLSGTYTITVSGAATTAGTVTTAAQPNITSVGTMATATITTLTTAAITKSGTNAAGNIGQDNNRFNTVFARASSASYADLAEIYLTDSDYPAGTVVIFGGAKEVTESDQYADSRLAGVISTNPAFVMNDGAEGQPIALQGRVPCSVVGNIVKGDLITTSDTPGVATRLDSNHWRPGTVLGKALENYNSTEPGVIEVVVGRV